MSSNRGGGPRAPREREKERLTYREFYEQCRLISFGLTINDPDLYSTFPVNVTPA